MLKLFFTFRDRLYNKSKSKQLKSESFLRNRANFLEKWKFKKNFAQMRPFGSAFRNYTQLIPGKRLAAFCNVVGDYLLFKKKKIQVLSHLLDSARWSLKNNKKNPTYWVCHNMRLFEKKRFKIILYHFLWYIYICRYI